MTRLVDGRRQQVEWRLIGKLHDKLTHVGLEHLYATFAKKLAQCDLFRNHRLTLDGSVDTMPGRNFSHVLASGPCVVSPEDVPTTAEDFGLERNQVVVKLFQAMFPDRVPPFPQGLPVREFGRRGLASLCKTTSATAYGLTQRGILQDLQRFFAKAA